MAHQDDSGRTPTTANWRFVRTQSIKGGLGLGLCLGYLLLVGRPDASEIWAFLGLVAPIGLALLSLVGLRLRELEAASLVLFAALIALLSILTSGLGSPLLVWLALVPFEAALIGRRGMVAFAGAAAVAALATVAFVQVSGDLPPSRLPEPPGMLVFVSVLVAIVQASLMAIAAQERHLAADAAAEAGEARYRFLAENALDLITGHGPDGRIRFASPAAQSLLGYAPERLVGMSLAEFAHPDDRGGLANAFAAASEGRAATAELRLTTSDGKQVWSEFRCQPARAGRERASDIVAVTRDVSERKAHERELITARDLAEDASRAKTRFLANMSHELRTPLNAIIGFSEIMTHEMFGQLGTPRYLEYARLINESGMHLLKLINSILDMSKIEAGRFKIVREYFDLEGTVAQALALVALQAERKGVMIEKFAAPQVNSAFADPGAVMQILLNLLTNALKFTPPHGTVTVTAVVSDQGLELSVSDTGVGIEKADLERLGRPFEQVESEFTRAKEGTGLGLALVRALAHLHGGYMSIESVLGEGTTVRVHLPNANADAQHGAAEAVA